MRVGTTLLADTAFEFFSAFVRGTLIWVVFAILFIAGMAALYFIKRRRRMRRTDMETTEGTRRGE